MEPRHDPLPTPTEDFAPGPVADTEPSGPADQYQSEDAVPSLWQPGDVLLGLYEVRGVLGEGGMGIVYRVHHRDWHLDLAVKSPRAEVLTLAGGADRLEREAETWMALGLHPHVVSCYYVRRLGGIPRVFAEFVEGGSLEDWIRGRDGQPPPLYHGGPEEALGRILDIAIQFAWGLHHAHEQGLVHQDVKPHNLMLTSQGMAKVTDFGLAKAGVGAPASPRATDRHSLLVSAGGMTPAYCSPEQADRQALTRKTDVWSWAVSVLEAFTGDVTWTAGPAAGEALEGYLEMGAGDPALPRMPKALAALLRRCLRRDPHERPRDMLEVADAVQDVFRQVAGRPYPRTAPQPAQLVADALNNRALSSLDLGKGEEAEKTWEKALQGEPLHPEATYNLGLVRWRRAQLQDHRLVHDLTVVRAAHQADWKPSYLLALVHLERGDLPAAAELLDSLEPAAREQPEVQEARALAREPGPGGDSALRWSRDGGAELRAVSLDPDGRCVLCVSAHKESLVKESHIRVGRLTRVGRLRQLLGSDLSARPSTRGYHMMKRWDLATGQCLRSVRFANGVAVRLCLTHEGRYALTRQETRYRLWDLTTGPEVASFALGENGETVFPDPAPALSKAHQEALRKLHEELLRVLGFRRHQEDRHGPVTAVAFSPNGELALSGTGDGTLRLWDEASGRCVRTVQGHERAVTAAAFSPCGGRVLTGGQDGTVRVWDPARGRCLRTIAAHKGPVTALTFRPDGRLGVSGGGDPFLRFWPLPDARPAPLAFCRVVASELVLAYEQNLGQARQARQRGDVIEAARHLRRARAQPGCARTPEVLEEWGRLFSRLPRQAFRDGWLLRTLEGHSAPVVAVSVSADGRWALSGGQDGTARLWNTGAAGGARVLQEQDSPVTAVSLGAEGRSALTGGGDKLLRLWDAQEGTCRRTFPEHQTCISSAGLTGDGRWALSASRDKIALWHADKESPVRRLFDRAGGEVTSAVLSADRRLVVAANAAQVVKVWSVADGRCLCTMRGHGGRVNAVSLSPDGQCVLSASSDQTLRLWNVTGGCLRTFHGHAGPVTAGCFSADGRFVLSGSQDQTLRLWETATGRCVHTFRGPTGAVTSVALTPDARLAVSGGADHAVRVWMLDWELEEKAPANWDEEARRHLEIFLTAHTETAPATWPLGRPRRGPEGHGGKSAWDENDFQDLLFQLGCAGYGWLREKGVREELERMASDWRGPAPVTAPSADGPTVLELPRSGLSVEGGTLVHRHASGPVRVSQPLERITLVAVRREFSFARRRRRPVLSLVLALLGLTIINLPIEPSTGLSHDAWGRPAPAARVPYTDAWASSVVGKLLRHQPLVPPPRPNEYPLEWGTPLNNFLEDLGELSFTAPGPSQRWCIPLLVALGLCMFYWGWVSLAVAAGVWAACTWGSLLLGPQRILEIESSDGTTRYPLDDARPDCEAFVRTLRRHVPPASQKG
jgi:WD40 repeat protein/serine/threonine protein kinase